MATPSRMFYCVLSMSMCVTLLLLLAPISDAQVPLFIFGDSLYDTGMTLYNGVKNAGAEFWPYGETYFGQPSGRYCDGRNIPDFIAKYAGLPYPRPYLLPGLNDFTKGVNFASASACVLVGTRPNTINLKLQVDYFNQMVPRLKQQVGEAKANTLLAKAVYLFNIGANDYVSFIIDNIQNLPNLSSSTKQLYMDKVLGNLTIHIKTIYNQGGRKFAFQNIGPLGCMPSMKKALQSNGSCVSEPLQIAKMHNDAFLALVKKLETQLTGFKYSVYDSYSSAYLHVLNGNKYGFTNTGTACCGSGTFNGEYTCQFKEFNFTVCKNPSDYLYFDAGHYTQKADKEFSKEFWSGGSNLVAPYNLKNLFSMN